MNVVEEKFKRRYGKELTPEVIQDAGEKMEKFLYHRVGEVKMIKEAEDPKSFHDLSPASKELIDSMYSESLDILYDNELLRMLFIKLDMKKLNLITPAFILGKRIGKTPTDIFTLLASFGKDDEE